MKPKQKGFTLIELLIVVGILLTLAALAVPSYLRSRMSANESSAVASIRAILDANAAYSITYGNGFAPDLTTLGGNLPADCHNANLIDSGLASGTKSGYKFSYVLSNPVPNPVAGCVPGGFGFTVQATAIAVGGTGQRSFCSDESNVIRFDPAGAVIPAPCASSGMSPLP